MVSKDDVELKNISPFLHSKIAKIIQATENSSRFGSYFGLTASDMMSLRFDHKTSTECEAIFQNLYARSINAKRLALFLFDVRLEKPLFMMQDFLEKETFDDLIAKLDEEKSKFTGNGTGDYTNRSMVFKSTISENSGLNSVKEFSSKSSYQIIDESFDHDSTFKLICEMLQAKSVEFNFNEFDYTDNNLFERKVNSHFTAKIKSSEFSVDSYCLSEIFKQSKSKRKLYNVIWCYLNYKLLQFKILKGFSFVNDHLLLFFPNRKYQTLHDIIHRPYATELEQLTTNQRLRIVKEIGIGLSFLHENGGFHGKVTSNNVLINNEFVILTGFDQFCAQLPDYLKGLNSIKKTEVNIEIGQRRDTIQYVELLCELWWNVQRYNYESDVESLLIKDIANGSILNPKVKYANWNNEYNDKIRSIVQMADYKENIILIAKIVESLPIDNLGLANDTDNIASTL